MIIIRQKEYTRFEPTLDFVAHLEEIATQSQRAYPKASMVGFEVLYRPGSSNIRAEIHLEKDDQDLVYVQVMKDGRILDGFNLCPLTVVDLRNQLIGSIDQLLREYIPGSKEKLEFLKAQIIGLR